MSNVVQQLQLVEQEVKMSESDDGDRNHRNRKKENPTSTCNENVEQYLVNSTLHGLRYVGDRKISYFERYESVVFLSFYFVTEIIVILL